MNDPRDYKQFLLDLPPEEFRRLVEVLGGDSPTPEAVFAWEATGTHHEQIICLRIKKAFGVTILTSGERRDEQARLATEASNRAAAAADRQATAAEKANETAERALRVAHHAMFWTALATAVAVLALVVSLFKK